jgi:trigger factor
LKDFEDALVGMTPGQTKEFPVVFPADYPKTELAGKTAVFTATVHEVKEKILPRLDDAFAQEAYHCKDVAELRAKMTEDMKSRRSVEQRNKMIDQIADQLLNSHAFDVPPSLVELEHQRLVRQAVERMRTQGADVSRWGEDRQKEFVAQFAKSAERNVRMSMLVGKIADGEHIECGDVDFDTHLDKLAKALGQAKDAVKRFVEQRDQKAEIEERVRYEKALDFLIEKADIVEGR